MRVNGTYLLMLAAFVAASLYLINNAAKMKNVYNTAPLVEPTYHT